MGSAVRCPTLERHLQSELQNAWIKRTRDLSERCRIQSLRQRPVRCSRRLPGWNNVPDEVRVIQNIERFGARLQAKSFFDLEGPAERKIEIHEARPAQRVPSNVAIGS